MPAGDLITAFNQYELNGLLMGRGTDFLMTKVDGLLDKPDIKSTDFDRQDAWGEYPGRDMYKGRKVVVTCDIINELGNFETNVENLRSALAIGDIVPPPPAVPFVFYRDWPVAGKRYLWVRPGKMALPSEADMILGHAQAIFELKANDPRHYSLTTQSVAVSGTTTVTNLGNTASAPVITIPGAATNPAVTSNTEGKLIRVNVSVPGGQNLVIDMRQKSILLNGVNVYANLDVVNSQWWKLQPGGNSITSTAACTVAFPYAWV